MIRVAILGAGIGRKHLDGYRALPGRYRVAAPVDLDTTRARAVAGKHVICEKPLGASLADADRLLAAAKAAGKRLTPTPTSPSRRIWCPTRRPSKPCRWNWRRAPAPTLPRSPT